MRFFSILFYAFAALAASNLQASGETRDLILIHPGAPGSLYDLSATEFGRRLDQKLQRSYRVVVIANPALGDGPALLDSVKNGRAAFVLASSAMVSVSDSFAIFELPFLIRSREQLSNIRGALLAGYLEPEAGKKGFHILGVWENGFRHFTNDRRPIRYPDDLKGLKIAVPPANMWREKLLRAFGADPIPLASRALPDALRTQIVDGQEAPLTDIAAWHLAATQRHLSLSDHLYSPAFLVTSTAEFDALPADVREAITEEARAMEAWIQKTAIKMESELVDTLDQKMELGQIDLDSFRAVSGTLYGEFVRTVPNGSKMIEIMQPAADVTASGHGAGN
ncbi:MAG: TRAP transporter substrate-binding protein [Rhodomicrobiaceae bacterium]